MQKRTKWKFITVYACILAAALFCGASGSYVSASAGKKKSAKFLSVRIGDKNMMKQTYTLIQGNTAKLVVSTKPAKAKNSLTFRSDNKKIVKINKKGEIKGIKPGTAKIRVILSGSYKKKKTWVKINVMKLVFDKPVIKAPTPSPNQDSDIKLLHTYG